MPTVAVPSALPLWIPVAIFLISAAVIAGTGTLLASLGDRLADRTGLGEAVTGALFLGLITALPGLAASIMAALDDRPAVAIGNALGGIAIQTTFLAVADIVYRRANLEHAAASVPNMIQTVILIVLLTLVLLGLSGPVYTIMGYVDAVTPVLLVTAVAGFVLVMRSRDAPMWSPRPTRETVSDLPAPGARHESLARLLILFAVGAVAVVAAGAAAAYTTGVIADRTGLAPSVAGALLSGVATSLPELVTTVAAVRRGALTLAVSDIVGGNFFDVLFVCAADAVYLSGSLYHAPGLGRKEIFLTGLTILLNLTLLLGQLYRQRRGPANIGFESVLMLVIYLVGLFLLIRL